MLRIEQIIVIAALATVAACAEPAHAAEAKDHPMLKRVEGSSILRATHLNYDEFTIALSPAIFNYRTRKFDEWKHIAVEGERTTVFYRMPQNLSTLEALRNYENDLKGKGFQTLFSGFKTQLDNGFGRFVNQVYKSEEDYHKQKHTMKAAVDYRYLAMKKSSPQGDVYVTAFFAATVKSWVDKELNEGQVVGRVDVIECKPMGTRMVTVNAEQMAAEIAASGRVALYGIYFDFNKTDIRPESGPALEEMSKYLKADSSVQLLVVGHTDNAGGFEFNRDLSQRRAKAVVDALVGRYGIAPARLVPFGVSFAAPVAPNTTEDGRAKNRRVELVRL